MYYKLVFDYIIFNVDRFKEFYIGFFLLYWILIKNFIFVWFYFILIYMDGFFIFERKFVVFGDFDRWDMFERFVDERF